MKALVIATALLAPVPSAFAASTETASLLDLHDRFVGATKDLERLRILEQISRSTPTSLADVSAVYDLFMRFRNPYVFDAALKAVSLTRPNGRLGALFIDYMKQDDPLSVFFGIKGAMRLRDPRALPVIEAIARRPFAFSSPAAASVPADKNQWWAQYQALVALAEWEGKKSWPLLKEKAHEAPRVARIMSRYFWKDSFSLFRSWMNSWFALRRRISEEGFSGYIPCSEFRQTWDAALRLFRRRRVPKEIQASLAIEIGLGATDAELAPFEADYHASQDPSRRLIDADVLFSARRPAVIPFLKEYAKTNPDPDQRAAAVGELAELLAPKDLQELLKWVVVNDPDPDNRQTAAGELRALEGGRTPQPRPKPPAGQELVPLLQP